MKSIEVKVLKDKKCADLKMPFYQTEHAAGVDLYAAVEETIVLKPHQVHLVPTGLKVAIPEGYEAQIRPRSGLALKHSIGLLNSPGTIDADYRGEVGIIMFNFGNKDFVVNRGDRIAQMIFCEVSKAKFVEVDDLDVTTRNEGGFGHTGI